MRRMGTGNKKLSLPLFGAWPTPAGGARRLPSVDAARRNLGGRGATTLDAGRIVALDGAGGVTVVGVVLFASAGEIDVWIDGGIVRRTRSEEARPFLGVVPDELVALAADASLFARLREGQRVRYEARRGELAEGAIVEKCRFGALVLRDDGKIMAVGFRKVWPLVASVDAPN